MASSLYPVPMEQRLAPANFDVAPELPGFSWIFEPGLDRQDVPGYPPSDQHWHARKEPRGAMGATPFAHMHHAPPPGSTVLDHKMSSHQEHAKQLVGAVPPPVDIPAVESGHAPSRKSVNGGIAVKDIGSNVGVGAGGPLSAVVGESTNMIKGEHDAELERHNSTTSAESSGSLSSLESAPPSLSGSMSSSYTSSMPQTMPNSMAGSPANSLANSLPGSMPGSVSNIVPRAWPFMPGMEYATGLAYSTGQMSGFGAPSHVHSLAHIPPSYGSPLSAAIGALGPMQSVQSHGAPLPPSMEGYGIVMGNSIGGEEESAAGGQRESRASYGSQLKRCPVCQKVLRRDLTRHMRIHEAVAEFRCPYPRDKCNHKRGQFNRPYEYKKHLMNSHFSFSNEEESRNAPNLQERMRLEGQCHCGAGEMSADDWIIKHVGGRECPLLRHKQSEL